MFCLRNRKKWPVEVVYGGHWPKCKTDQHLISHTYINSIRKPKMMFQTDQHMSNLQYSSWTNNSHSYGVIVQFQNNNYLTGKSKLDPWNRTDERPTPFPYTWSPNMHMWTHNTPSPNCSSIHIFFIIYRCGNEVEHRYFKVDSAWPYGARWLRFCIRANVWIIV